jgi:hypothetical protein
MRYPAFFLVGGCGSLFLGFCAGICLYYGLGVALLVLLLVGIGLLVYERWWAAGHADSYNALNLALGALFFRSCLPQMGDLADTHEHLNLPPLAEKEKEKGGKKKDKEGKEGKEGKDKDGKKRDVEEGGGSGTATPVSSRAPST